MIRDYFPPEMVIGFFRGIKTGLLTFVVTAGATYGMTQNWTTSIVLGAVGAATALGGRTYEGVGDARLRREEEPRGPIIGGE